MAVTIDRPSKSGHKEYKVITAVAAILGVVTAIVLIFLVRQWSDPVLAEQPGNVVNALVAAANMAFVVLTWAVFKGAQDQLAQSRRDAADREAAWRKDYELAHAELGLVQQQLVEQAAANKYQLEESRRAYEEAVKARIDQSAPRVSIQYMNSVLNIRPRGQNEQAIYEGAEFVDGPDTGRIALSLRWLVTNWGGEPVAVDYPSDADGGRQTEILAPQGTLDVLKVLDGPASWWAGIAEHGYEPTSEENPWWVKVQIVVNDCTGDVLDTYTWGGEVRPFNQDGSRIAVRASREWVNSLPYGVRARYYNVLANRGDTSSS
jgi:hypothetical protein